MDEECCHQSLYTYLSPGTHGKANSYQAPHSCGSFSLATMRLIWCMTQRRGVQVLGLTTALGVIRGTNSAEFAIALIFSMVVMYDASGVRLHAGKTASVLNMIITVSAAATHAHGASV